MPNAFRDYVAAGDPDVARARGAALMDLAVGATVCVLVWPFPIVRVALASAVGSEATGWAIHVPLLLVTMALAAWTVSALTMALGRRTVGMYFADLGFPAPPTPRQAFGWALPWTAAGAAGLLGSKGLAARFARRRLRSTKPSP